MNIEYIKKGSLTMELTIEVDVHFAYNKDSLFDYNVWLDAGYTNPIDIYPAITDDNQILITEAIEERITEIKNEG